LQVMESEPAQHKGLAESVRVRFLQCRLEDFLPAAEPNYSRFYDFAAKKDRRVAFFAREIGKVGPVLVTSRVMGQKIFDGFDIEPAQSRQFRPRDPLQFTERLGLLDHSMGTAARIA